MIFFSFTLLSDAEVSENILEGFLRGYALFARDFCKVVDDHAEVFGEDVAAPVFVIGTPKFQDWVAISIKS